jgi:hypothetical protein
MSQNPNSTVEPKISPETEQEPETAETPLPLMIPEIGFEAMNVRIVSTQSVASGDSTEESKLGTPGIVPLSGVGSSRQPADVQEPEPPEPPPEPIVPPMLGDPFAPAPPVHPDSAARR